jgi:hypothetical protein
MISGTKVVCVDDLFPASILNYYTNLPLKDRVYTIRDVEVGVGIDGQAGEIAVTLVELINPVSEKHPHRERGFKVERFRELEPAVEVEEEIEEEMTI